MNQPTCILLLFLPLFLGGCFGEVESFYVSHPEAYCQIEAVVIYEYGDEQINREAVAAVLDALSPLFPDLTVEYVAMPATSSYADYLTKLPQFGQWDGILPVAYSDQVDADSPANGRSMGRLIHMYPQEWRERTGASWAPVPPDGGNGTADPWSGYDRLVLLHEIGHELGLVNRGIPMQTSREHAESPGHSNDPNSPMHAGFETTDRIEATSNIRDFTEQDWDDLLAAREPDGVCYPFIDP